MNTDRTSSGTLLARSRGLVRSVALACLCATAVTAAARGDDDPAAAQRKQQLAELTRNFEQNLQPILRMELDSAKTFCGDLPVDARRRIAAAGREAVQQTARDVAQMHAPQAPADIRRARPVADGNQRRANEPIDARRRIHDAVAAAVQTYAPPEARAAYEREQELSVQSLRRRDCLQVMAIIAPHLALTAEQRAAIGAALEAGWDSSWTAKLAHYSHLMLGADGRLQAPRFTGDVIKGHLDSAQRVAWEEWIKGADERVFAGWMGVRLGPAVARLQADDPWWNP